MVTLPSGISQIRLPLSGIGLSHINSYLLKGDDGYALVDCGWDTPDVLEAMQAGLKDLGVSLGDVRTLVVTHRHVDHYGLAGTLLRLGSMRLLMHRLDWVYLNSEYGDYEQHHRESSDWLARNGVAEERTVPQGQALEAFRRLSLVVPDIQLEDQDSVPMVGSGYRVVWTPGHTEGHICLYEGERQFLIAGDHVLDPITPNVSMWLSSVRNPLGDFLDSLRKVARLEADLVLPAHGEPFMGLQRRVDELLAHHDAREAAILAALEGRSMNAAEVAAELPWTRRKTRLADLPGPQQHMAVVETLSHLEHLRLTGRAEREDHGGLLNYLVVPTT